MEKEITPAVKVQPAIFAAVERLVAQSVRFDTVDDFVNFVLAELLAGDAAGQATDDEQKQIEIRLRQLGYMS